MEIYFFFNLLKTIFFDLPGIRATPLRTASCTALIPMPKTVRPSSIVDVPSVTSNGKPNKRDGLEHGRLAYLEGITVDGRAFGCNCKK